MCSGEMMFDLSVPVFPCVCIPGTTSSTIGRPEQSTSRSPVGGLSHELQQCLGQDSVLSNISVPATDPSDLAIGIGMGHRGSVVFSVIMSQILVLVKATVMVDITQRRLTDAGEIDQLCLMTAYCLASG